MLTWRARPTQQVGLAGRAGLQPGSKPGLASGGLTQRANPLGHGLGQAQPVTSLSPWRTSYGLLARPVGSMTRRAEHGLSRIARRLVPTCSSGWFRARHGLSRIVGRSVPISSSATPHENSKRKLLLCPKAWRQAIEWAIAWIVAWTIDYADEKQ